MNINKQWQKLTNTTYLSDYFVIIFFPIVVAWHYHSGKALRLIVISALSAMALELLFNRLIYKYIIKTKNKDNLPLAAFMGICTAMALPASAPIWFPIIGLFFSYVFLFGLTFLSKKQKIFSKIKIIPAAAAITFLSLFPKILFVYNPLLLEGSGESGQTIMALPSIANMLLKGFLPHQEMYRVGDILTGAVTGPLGTGCIIVILAAFVFLLLRKPLFMLTPFSFILTSIFWAFLFPRQELGRLSSIGYELSAGMLLFAAVFLLSLPRYLPRNNLHKLIYGSCCALLTMALRRILALEETVFIAIFLMNLSLIYFNKNVQSIARARRIPKTNDNKQTKNLDI